MNLVGGPLDGTALRRKPSAGWIWADADGRVSLAPTDGKRPYRRADWGRLGRVWLFAGHSHGVCAGCGAIHELAARCELCGGLLVRM